jgi:hypothetical protein
MVGDKVAVTEDLQELHLFTSTFIQHLPHLILNRSHQCLPTVEDMEVAVNEGRRNNNHIDATLSSSNINPMIT